MLQETGQDKSTIVIFLGEQGPQFPGGKWTLWDNGAKSSMIVKWPEVIKPKTQTNAIVQYEDVTPTLVDIAGGKAIAGLDGSSVLSVLKGKVTTHRDYAFLIHNNIPEGPAYPIRAIRGNKYKLIMNLKADSAYYIKYMMDTSIATLPWTTWIKKAKTDALAKTLIQRISNRPSIEFYNIQEDPFELNNLALKTEYQVVIKEYQAKLKNWMIAQGDSGAALDVSIEK